MKKTTLFCLLLCLALSLPMLGQGDIKVSGHLGVPIGDASNISDFAFAVDLGYFFEINDAFSAGPTIGYSHSFGDDVNSPIISAEIDDIQFLPIGGEARYHFNNFFVGGGLGYALGINEENDGGFYYSPRFGYTISDKIAILLAYRGVTSDGDSWDILTAGVEINLN